MKIRLTTTLLLFLCISGSIVHAQKMVTRIYPIDPSLFSPAVEQEDYFGGFGEISGAAHPPKEPTDPAVELKQFFTTYGVPFPEGSSIRYEAVRSNIIVINTEENLSIFEKIFARIDQAPQQVAITGAFVSFTLEELKTIPGLDLPEFASSEQLMALRKKGKGVAEPFRLVTINGVNAVVENVEEIIYPTEFDIETTAPTGGRQNDKNGSSGRMGVIPGAFETREIGQVINITPVVYPDNTHINLCILPEATELSGEIDYGFTYTDEAGNKLDIPMKQPVFHSRNITTSIVLKNGGSVVVSGGWDEKNQTVAYIFISARLIDATGKLLVNDAPAPAKTKNDH